MVWPVVESADELAVSPGAGFEDEPEVAFEDEPEVSFAVESGVSLVGELVGELVDELVAATRVSPVVESTFPYLWIGPVPLPLERLLRIPKPPRG